MQKTKGKFIVIDGTDGSGKATQTALLVERLKDAGHAVEVADFPQYGQKSAGMVEEYLNGKYGTADEVGPYRGSIFYACDRYDASFKIRKWLDEGKIVVSNRYVTANMGHQGGKIKDDAERKKYFEWLYELEFGIFGIPRPDMNVILHVDAAVAQKLVDQKGSRDYVGGSKRDIHENDLAHLRNAEKVYLEIAKTFPDFALIECTRNNEIMSKTEINDLLWRTVSKIVEPAKPALEQEPTTTKPLAQNQNIWEEAVYFDDRSEKLTIDFKKSYDDGHAIVQEEIKLETTNNKPIDCGNIIVEKILPTAKLPTRANEFDAGLDVYSSQNYILKPGDKIMVATGLKLVIPDGYVGLIWDKGGIAKIGLHTMAGVVDATYRGEMFVTMVNLSHSEVRITAGQKVAQILIQKVEFPKIVEGKVDSDTTRGEGKLGSSGLF